MTIREAARRVERDVKAVHGDVHALLNAGILDRTEDGRVILPYDAVRVDFTVSKATDPRHSANRKARVGRRSA